MLPGVNGEAAIGEVLRGDEGILQIDWCRRRTVSEFADDAREIALIGQANDWRHQKLEGENGGRRNDDTPEQGTRESHARQAGTFHSNDVVRLTNPDTVRSLSLPIRQ